MGGWVGVWGIGDLQSGVGETAKQCTRVDLLVTRIVRSHYVYLIGPSHRSEVKTSTTQESPSSARVATSLNTHSIGTKENVKHREVTVTSQIMDPKDVIGEVAEELQCVVCYQVLDNPHRYAAHRLPRVVPG